MDNARLKITTLSDLKRSFSRTIRANPDEIFLEIVEIDEDN